MKISIRKFEEKDIINKIKWINDERNNQYLHYNLPLEYGNTLNWYQRIKDISNRFDAIIEVDGKAVGLIGLLNIDEKNCKAEYYISMGEQKYKGKGVATEATRQLLDYSFCELKLNRIYLYTEKENLKAQRLFEKIGFKKEGILSEDLYFRGKFVDRYIYGITKEIFYKQSTPAKELSKIYYLDEYEKNKLYIKREDLIPICFGGNKARKAIYFFREIDNGGYDSVVTYGSSSSNHCRIISNLAVNRGLACYIISPEETFHSTFNSKMMSLFGADFTIVPVSNVHVTIEEKLQLLKNEGKKPYFIAGGGHGNLGTQAYVDCYEEIKMHEQHNNIFYDYIFLASGTGTTQAGLVCGQLINGDKRKIIGISIARKNPQGRQVILDSIYEYLNEKEISLPPIVVEKATIFIDDYIGSCYGEGTNEIQETICEMLNQNGIALDSTYTAKAYTGMKSFICINGIKGKNILFIHTGGTPLFFDDLQTMEGEDNRLQSDFKASVYFQTNTGVSSKNT